MQTKTLVETWVIVAVFPGSSHAHACTCISMPSRRESWSETDWTLVFDTEEDAAAAAEEFGVYEGADSLGATDVFTFKCSRVREVSRATSVPSTLPPPPSDSAGFSVVNEKE